MLARLGPFFDAKERLRSFVDQTNRRNDDESFPVPSDDEITRGLSLAADPNLAPFLFGWLENPHWLKQLVKRNALTDLSTP